jgi:hypothetical protein
MPSTTFVILRRAAALLCGAVGLFFTFYSIRLALVWGTVPASSRQSGMYIGAVAFPVLAVSLLFACRHLLRSST